MKKLLFVGILLTAGCATRYLDYTVTKTQPDGVVVKTEVKAHVNSFCYDSSLEGFEWVADATNTTVRVDKHGSTGGATNVAVIAEAAGKWADATKAAAAAVK